MIGRILTTLVVAGTLAGCESATETAPLGPTLDPDGAPLAVAGPGIVTAVTGSGISNQDASLRVLTFNALEAADGTVRGQYTVVLNGNARRLDSSRGKLMGSVTCVHVDGNRAFIAGDTRRDDLEALPLPVGGVAIEVIDGGEGPGSVDEISPVGLFQTVAGANQWCENGVPGRTFEAESGQVQIH